MESTWPEWLTETMVLKALGETKLILDIDVEPAVPFGEHFLSTILRVKVKYKNHSCDTIYHTSIILKSFPPGSLKTFIEENGMLNREIYMYTNVLPRISDILGRYISPKHFESCDQDVLILEDLTLDGFRNCDRIQGLDLRHCLFALKLLADFHSASYILNKTRPDVIEHAGKEIHYTENNIFQKDFIFSNFNFVVEELKNWPGYEKYSTRLRDIMEKTWNDSIEAILPNKNEINVLNHGDFWTNNILFQYDAQNEIIDAKVIDFQFTRWTTPAVDLQIFFTISVRDKECIPLLIDSYLNRLNENIKPQQMSKEQLLDALRRTECFSLIVSVCILPMLLLDPVEANKIRETYTNNDFNSASNDPMCQLACKTDNFKKIFLESLKYYEGISLL